MIDSKIGIKQLFILFIISSTAPLIRMIPIVSAHYAKQAAWVVPFFVIIPALGLIYIINILVNKVKGKNDCLEDVFSKAFGKVFTKIILIVLSMWFLILAAIQVRIFAERFTSTLAIHAPLEFFMITILSLVYITSRINIQTFARFTEIFSWLFMFVLLLIAVLVAKQVDVENLLPVSAYDMPNIRNGIDYNFWGFLYNDICVFYVRYGVR